MKFSAPVAAIFLIFFGLLPARADRVRVACVGDSITFGIGVKTPSRDSYPARLAQILGPGYEVGNFGASGATLLRRGNNPYVRTAAFRNATKFRPDIVIILLGTNDSKTRNWDGRAKEFRPDYESLVAHFGRLRERPRILLVLPPPALRDDGDIRERILATQRGTIREMARGKGLPVVDVDVPFRKRPAALPDGIHPNEAGAMILAKTVARALRASNGGARPRRGRDRAKFRRHPRPAPHAR